MKNRIWIPQLLFIGATVLAIARKLHEPSNGLHFLLLWLWSGILSYLAFKSYKFKRVGWVWLFGVMSLMYNPLLKPLFNSRGYHSKEYWGFLYLGSIVIVFVSIFFMKPQIEPRQ